MKKIFRTPVVIASTMVLASLLIVAHFASAQQAFQSTTSNLESQMSELIESQNRLASAMEEAFIAEEEIETGGITMALTSGTAPRARCYDDFQSWPSSDTYKQSDWDLNIAQGLNPTYAPYHNFVDVNGDGLIDYFFIKDDPGNEGARRSCLYLN
ncbi:MAG TPA: hypothetical protein PKA32_04470, partial [Candidatus Gracilibacteria bacterium]|nr:hypothetical protein [Candidatus Gracilibacteria bacterium]